ncbi:thioredoxin family protein [Aeoliella sp. SH292]|uniref:thioredoxin family protein n=1 Tax=Aeoliella sp. SH292 TaxID=3454464 RepID=UPI003F9530C6
MRICKQFLVVTLFVLQAGVAMGNNGMGVPWQTDLDKARAQAEKEQKLLLIHFYSDSCGPCRVLDATVFNQPTVAGAVQTHYVPVKLNTNEFPATAERFGITRVPTDVVITPQGRMVERLTSPQTPMAYVAQMSGIAEQHRAKTARDFKVASHGSGTSVPVNPNLSKLPASGDMNSFTGLPQSGLVSNPYAQAVEAAQQHTAAMNATTPSQPAATQETTVSSVSIANPYTNQPVTTMESAAPPVAGERYATAALAPVTPEPTATTPTGPVAQAAPQLPPNSPPLGFFGYCPVTMKQENRWQQGDARFGCYHRGRTYLFTSAEKRDAFLANGDEFAPALSGIDPVLAIDSNKVEAGKQEFGIEYEGRFYLFSSEDNLRKFYNQPQVYAAGVRQAMNAGAEGRTIR